MVVIKLTRKHKYRRVTVTFRGTVAIVLMRGDRVQPKSSICGWIDRECVVVSKENWYSEAEGRDGTEAESRPSFLQIPLPLTDCGTGPQTEFPHSVIMQLQFVAQALICPSARLTTLKIHLGRKL